MISVIVPYYKQPEMLKIHLAAWLSYTQKVREAMHLIVVDDGSAQQAKTVIDGTYNGAAAGLVDLQLYRITKDIPWNREGARNLGAHVATTPWLLHMDIDHVMPPASAEALAGWVQQTSPDARRWYRFKRFRVGAADETRNKDAIPRAAKFGEIKPHIDSYLCSRDLYWKAGGYNEDFSGCLGGGSPFLRELEKVGGEPIVLPFPLHVYTSDKCPDASVNLDRNRNEYSRRRRHLERIGKIKGHDPLRFPWERVL